AVRRPHRARVGPGPERPADLSRGDLGSDRGRPAHRPRRAQLAQAVSVMTTIDESIWGARTDSVSALERELARLRRSSGAHAKEQGVPVARASVLNLVVFATREIHARRAAETIDELATRHPSRAIVIVADREPAGREPELEVRCDLPHSGGA